MLYIIMYGLYNNKIYVYNYTICYIGIKGMMYDIGFKKYNTYWI